MTNIVCILYVHIDHAFNLTLTKRSQTLHSSRASHKRTPVQKIRRLLAGRHRKGCRKDTCPNRRPMQIATERPSVETNAMLLPGVHRTPEMNSYFTRSSRLISCSIRIICHRATLSNDRLAKADTVQQVPEQKLTLPQNADVPEMSPQPRTSARTRSCRRRGRHVRHAGKHVDLWSTAFTNP